MIKSWGFDFFPSPQGLMDDLSPDNAEKAGKKEAIDPKENIAYFNFYLDLWTRAEEQGYDGVFLSEHHFGGGYSPSPNLLLPLIADRTETLRIGVMGMVLPYHNAWRIAEEVGMLDNLTGGRLEVGTSAGIPVEFAKVGMEPQEARARYDEALEILDAAMVQPVISYSGKYWNFEDMPIVPRPVQQPPPMWTTVVSVESARKAARRGSKITTGFVPTEKAKEIFDAYNEAAEEAGKPSGPEQLALRRQVILDLGEDDSKERAGEFAKAFRNLVESYDKRSITPGRKALDTPGTHTYKLGDDEFISGSPKEVAEEIIRQCKGCGAGHFQVVFAGHNSLEELAHSWDLFGREVTPLLKKA